MTRSALLALAVAGSMFAATLSCGDPVHDDAVNALGGEDANVKRGPLHRPGQPCLVCHGSSGPASPQFSVAGTVYEVKGEDTPLEGATVALTDATGAEHEATTNAAGNFYIRTSEWEPTAPIHVTVTSDPNTATMTTHIGRDGSCAGCHTSTPGPRSTGPVYLVVDRADLKPGGTP